MSARTPITAAEAAVRVRELGWWYQHFQLPSGVWTGAGRQPSYDPEIRWQTIAPFVPSDLSGGTVLDVGGNAGYFSVQMKKRGAARCVLVEPYEEFARQARFVAESFDTRIDIVHEDVHTFCLTTEERFDYVLFLGLFYHLKYPGIVLDRLAEMTRRRMYFQCIVGEDTPGSELPRLAFAEEPFRGDPTNWWVPDATALPALLRSAGMKVVAQPTPEVLVAEPEEYFGTVVYSKLVFPRYGKRGGAKFPGVQKVPEPLWQHLIERDSEPGT